MATDRKFNYVTTETQLAQYPVARAFFSVEQLLIEGYVHEDDITVDAIIGLVRSAEEHGEASIGTFGDRELQWRIVLPVADGRGAAEAAIEYLEQYLTIKREDAELEDLEDEIKKGIADFKKETKPWTPYPYYPYPTKTYPGPLYPGEPYITD